ncbi:MULTISPECIES: hypothetical protein [unclassified Francisella]|uniref:hypothetical protein n=1 Tax=unclassified Francisella TaxID=2610885 RepID=UPI002E301605|nr:MULTISPECIES: hypothetical protein [unclassified Francisella]MED7820070.1 hypothetical protein [Francisella sp. 19S2-4]MED7830890.1 hypothetical protein [Francisella sp. 19S2-10]
MSLTAYSAVYQTEENGVPDFSNIKSKDSKELNLKNAPVSVVNMNNVSNDLYRQYSYNQQQPDYYIPRGQDTLQSSFPERYTDNYYDFYGRNHHYESLMSSTESFQNYGYNGANNSRLVNNY